MNKFMVEKAIIANRPGESFVLVERVDGEDIFDLDMLDWQADTKPPTFEEVTDWYQTWKSNYDTKILADSEKITNLSTFQEELVEDYQIATTRLNAIITNGSSYTATQTRDAVIDMAKIQLRMLKLIKTALT